MLLTDARRPARTAPTARSSRSPSRTARVGPGRDRRGRRADHRTRWRADRSGRTSSRPRSPPSTTRPPRADDTDWPQILALYDAARALAAEPDGHAQPRGRGGHGRTARRPGSTCSRRSTTTPAWPSTTGSSRARPPARAGRRHGAAGAAYREAARRTTACRNSVTSRAAPIVCARVDRSPGPRHPRFPLLATPPEPWRRL